jgi:multiple sugar transport system permease protein
VAIGAVRALVGRPVRLLFWIPIMLGALSMTVPFIWMISTSLKTDQQAFAWPPALIPASPKFQNYADAWHIASFGRFYFNSTLVSVCTTIGSLTFSSLAAYGFAKYRSKRRDLVFIVVLATMMIPGQVTMIPNFFLLKHLSLLDTYGGLILPGLGSAFGIFFMRQSMLTVPDEFLDAARIDGASEYAVFLRVVVPLVRPAIATLAIFTFIASWNDFLGPLIVVKSDEMRTLPLAIAALASGHYVMSWPLLMAGACFVILPVLIVYLVAQKQFVEGINAGGLRG